MSIVLDIINTRKWLRSLAKVFVVCFNWFFWGLTLHKAWQKTKGGYMSAHTANKKEALGLCNSRIIYEHKNNDVQGHGTSNKNLSLIVCLSNVYRPSIPNYFPLLTMSLHIPK